MNTRIFRWIAVSIAFCAVAAQANHHTFRVEQVFSNADGNVQYVVMREASNSNNQNQWNTQILATTNAAGVTKQITFTSNLPSATTAGRTVLIATPGFAALNVLTPDYMMPARFVPTEGGSLNYANVDTIPLSGLPADGITAVNRNGNTISAIPSNFAGASTTMTAGLVGNIEYFNSSLDHYFMSSLAADLDALDTGRLAGWVRTGEGFMVYPSEAAAGGAGVNPVCRIRIPPPGDSHFFSASPQECSETLAKFPTMRQETPNAFYIALPVTSPGPTAGACPQGTIPVYRVFNNREDANHRYMTDRMIRAEMVMRGGIAEGYGDDAVIMCAPGTVSMGAGAPPGNPMPPPYEP